jgi:hypothetical protein
MLSALINVLRPKPSVSQITLILIAINHKEGYVGRIMMKRSVTQ